MALATTLAVYRSNPRSERRWLTKELENGHEAFPKGYEPLAIFRPATFCLERSCGSGRIRSRRQWHSIRPDEMKQLIGVHWLGEERIGAGRQSLLAVFGHSQKRDPLIIPRFEVGG